MGKIECYSYGSKHNFQTCSIVSVCHGASKTVGIQEPTKIGRKGILNDTNKRKELVFLLQHAFGCCMQNGLISP